MANLWVIAAGEWDYDDYEEPRRERPFSLSDPTSDNWPHQVDAYKGSMLTSLLHNSYHCSKACALDQAERLGVNYERLNSKRMGENTIHTQEDHPEPGARTNIVGIDPTRVRPGSAMHSVLQKQCPRGNPVWPQQ